MLNSEIDYTVNEYDIQHKQTQSNVLFRGIKTSSGVQTAKLKSLTGVNIWVLDEAEELTDEDVFNKIDLSVRSTKAKNIVILILNPSYRSHWIYKRFFLDANVPELHNGIVGNTTYIHTDYRDNLANVPADVLAEVERLKEKNQRRYNEEILGHWKDEPEGILFKRNELKRFTRSELIGEPAGVFAHIDVADQGNDYLALIVCKVYGKRVFCTDVVFSKAGERVTRPMAAQLLSDNKAELCLVESNNQGMLYSRMLSDTIESLPYQTKIHPYPAQGNKQARIYAQSEWVKESMYFLAESEYQHGSEYATFIENLTSYNESGANANDDAPDTVAGMARFLRAKIGL
jgi:PBSX family phage terminase large subunit